MKRILARTRFSVHAYDAAKTAADIARKTGAELVFLHVFSIPTYEEVLPYQDNNDVAESLFMMKLVKINFDKFLASDFLEGIKVAQGVSYTGVYEAITENVVKHEIDMIVMGTHGSSGFVDEFFIGSNTDKVIRKSSVPVLAVKSYGDTNYRKILFAGDFSDSLERNFDFIKSFAKIYDSEMMLLHVVTKGDFYYTAPMLKRIEDFALNHGLEKFSCHVFNAESVQLGINEFANMHDVQLISTITSGRRGLSRLLNGSVTGDVIARVSLPVLTIKG